VIEGGGEKVCTFIKRTEGLSNECRGDAIGTDVSAKGMFAFGGHSN
jgi:hypothetical protein